MLLCYDIAYFSLRRLRCLCRYDALFFLTCCLPMTPPIFFVEKTCSDIQLMLLFAAIVAVADMPLCLPPAARYAIIIALLRC